MNRRELLERLALIPVISAVLPKEAEQDGASTEVYNTVDGDIDVTGTVWIDWREWIHSTITIVDA